MLIKYVTSPESFRVVVPKTASRRWCREPVSRSAVRTPTSGMRVACKAGTKRVAARKVRTGAYLAGIRNVVCQGQAFKWTGYTSLPGA
jgi:hypothetical protein